MKNDELRKVIRGYIIYAMDNAGYSRSDMDSMLYAIDNVIHDVDLDKAQQIHDLVLEGKYDFAKAESRTDRIKSRI